MILSSFEYELIDLLECLLTWDVFRLDVMAMSVANAVEARLDTAIEAGSLRIIVNGKGHIR